VVISAYVMLVENCVSRGASACVQKPFDIDDLVMQVRQALKMAVDQQALKVPTYA
jgi:DNA-binding NtrC family response regulator